MIRTAIPSDRFRVIEMLRSAHAAAGFGDGSCQFQYRFSAAYADRAFASHTGSADATCIIMDIDNVPVGVLMARVFDYELGPTRIAKETVWWIDPEHRGAEASAMLEAYERWAAEVGAKAVGMAALAIAPRAGAIYARRGYHPAETHFIKTLTA